MFPEALLRHAVQQASVLVAKAAGPEKDVLRAAARAALGAPDTAALEQTLRQVFYDAFAAGGHAAAQQLGGGGAVVTLQGVSDVDWGAWKPGDPAAAGLASNGGLASLLDNAQATVNGISGSLLDQLGNTIGDGLTAGDSVDDIAGALSGIVGDPSRAEMIAHTETARAVTVATLDSYAANGVGQWDWVLSDGACPECEDAASNNPYPVGDDGDQPPLHPRCRCSASPVASSVSNDDGAGGSGGGSLLGDALGAGVDDLAGALDDAAGSVLGDEADTAATDAVDAATADTATTADLTALSDEDLSAALNDAAVSGDADKLDQVMAELDRRDAQATADREAAAKKAAAKAKRDAKAAALEEQRNADFEAALARGDDPEQAYADIWGKDPERVQKQAAIASLRAAGYTGRNYEELCGSQFKEYADQQWLKAEAETRGALLNKAGESAGIHPRTLFVGQDARARKYASEELLGFWQKYGRLTLEDFKAANLGKAGTAAGRAYYL